MVFRNWRLGLFGQDESDFVTIMRKTPAQHVSPYRFERLSRTSVAQIKEIEIFPSTGRLRKYANTCWRLSTLMIVVTRSNNRWYPTTHWDTHQVHFSIGAFHFGYGGIKKKPTICAEVSISIILFPRDQEFGNLLIDLLPVDLEATPAIRTEIYGFAIHTPGIYHVGPRIGH